MTPWTRDLFASCRLSLLKAADAVRADDKQRALDALTVALMNLDQATATEEMGAADTERPRRTGT